MRRAAVLGTLVLSLLTTSAAEGAAKPAPKPKPLCNLLQDDKGDGHSTIAEPVSSPALDIVGGDLATGKSTMVAVLRLASTNASLPGDAWSVGGYSWSFGVTSSLGQSFAFTASRGADGTMNHGAKVDSTAVDSDFKIVGNTFVWTIKRSAAPSLSRPKNVFGQFRGTSKIASSSADAALTIPSRYPDRALSCVKAP